MGIRRQNLQGSVHLGHLVHAGMNLELNLILTYFDSPCDEDILRAYICTFSEICINFFSYFSYENFYFFDQTRNRNYVSFGLKNRF